MSASPPGERQRGAGFVRAIGRGILWPLRRFFDPRFQGLARQADAHYRDLGDRLEVRIDDRHDQTAALVEGSRRTVLEAVGEVRELTTADMDAAAEANELIGRSLADLLGEVERLSTRLDRIEQRLNESGK